MPHLDILTFAPQIFWLLILFAICCFINYKILLPGIRICIHSREKKIEKQYTETKQLEEMKLELLSQIQSMTDHQKFMTSQLILDAKNKADALVKEGGAETNQSVKEAISHIKQDSKYANKKNIAKAASIIESSLWDSLISPNHVKTSHAEEHKNATDCTA